MTAGDIAGRLAAIMARANEAHRIHRPATADDIFALTEAAVAKWRVLWDGMAKLRDELAQHGTIERTEADAILVEQLREKQQIIEQLQEENRLLREAPK